MFSNMQMYLQTLPWGFRGLPSSYDIKLHILLAIDNETVLYWLLGKYKIKEGIIRDKIEKIYNKINDSNDLNDLNIKIILSWVHVHNDEKGNEIADRLAKLAMMNYYQSKQRNEIEPINSIDNWENINLKAIKNEIKGKQCI